MRNYKPIWTLFVVFALIIVGNSSVQAGPSVSISHDFLPYQDIKDSIEMTDGSFVNDAQVRLSKLRATFTYPLVFSQGRTIMFNEITYQRIDFNYRKTTSLIDRLHSVGYTLTLFHVMSEKWSALLMGKSSIASDLEVDISAEDFSFQTAAIFNRQFNQKLSMGLGLAYSTQFGSGELLPLLSIDWNNGAKWSLKALLPASLEIWYKYNKRINIGLLATGDGDNFRFDPGSYGDIYPEPNLRYTMFTIGPTAKINLSEKLILNVEAGIIGLHRFEFYSGDEEYISNDLEPSQYVRIGIQTDL